MQNTDLQLPKKQLFSGRSYRLMNAKDLGYASMFWIDIYYCAKRDIMKEICFYAHSILRYLLGAEDYWNHNRSDGVFSGFDFRNSLPDSRNKLPPSDKSAQGIYSTDLFVDAVRRAINNRTNEKPTFVYLPFQSVHGPLQAPQKYIDQYPQSMERYFQT